VLPGGGHVPMSDDPEQLVAELIAQRSDHLGPHCLPTRADVAT
jgi:hypothetical protein